MPQFTYHLIYVMSCIYARYAADETGPAGVRDACSIPLQLFCCAEGQRTARAGRTFSALSNIKFCLIQEMEANDTRYSSGVH